MAELKTQVTKASVDKFLQGIRDEKKREDCYQILKLMKKATKAEPKMWGGSIIGFGDYHYKYESGRENDWFITGFSPRKANFAFYLMGRNEKHTPLLDKLGKYSTAKSCVYIKRLRDVDEQVLQQLISECAEACKGYEKLRHKK